MAKRCSLRRSLPVLVVVSCLLGGCQPDGAATAFQDIAYVPGPGVAAAQRLDLFLPTTGAPPYPLIIAIHGGAFRFGDKADGQRDPMLAGLARGYAVASLNYRLSGEARFPAQIQDVKAAIRFLRAESFTYHLDPGRFAVWGGSAGGMLAALAGTTGDTSEFDDPALGHPEVSSRVQAVVDWFGPVDFLRLDAQFRASGSGTPDHDAADSPESRLLGGLLQEHPDEARRAAAATWLTPGDPPFRIEHGDADPLVPLAQSQALATAIRALPGGPPVELVIHPGAGHGTAVFSKPETVAATLDFLDAHLRPKPSR